MSEEKKQENSEYAIKARIRGTFRCSIRFEIVRKLMIGRNISSVGDIMFRHKDGKTKVSGTSLLDAQTGCEIWERLGAKEPCTCKIYDEQIKFVSETGRPITETSYCITLESGRTLTGTTGAAGKTGLIKSANEQLRVQKVEFIATDKPQPLCPRDWIPGTSYYIIEFEGVAGDEKNNNTADGGEKKG
ncbi:MAG: hypothetical protein LBV07_01120, partial [Syntrophobacterales bacterium]|nr:hypothetical protein [Syntrophobacterales bacterium]